MHCRRCAAFVVVATLTSVVHAQGPYDFTKTLTSAGESVNVDFRAWAPENVDRIRGVLFNLPGSGGNTMGSASNLGWQRFADELGFAILGVRWTPAPGGSSLYLGSDPTSGRANIVSLLDTVATGLGRPEIRNAPLLPFGTSAGGFQASFVANAVPERTLGYMADKGVMFGFGSYPPDLLQVPGMLVFGNTDEQVDPYYVDQVYQDIRSQGGEVSEVVDWVGHANVSPHLRDTFIHQVIKERYPAGQVPSLVPGNPLPLVAIPQSQGWRGEVGELDDPIYIASPLAWPKIAPAASYGNGANSASWLVNETMAMVYRAHIARTVGIPDDALSIVAEPTGWNDVIHLAVQLTGTTYSGIDIYDDAELIAHLDFSTDPTQRILYQLPSNGLHTFVAVATYMHSGQTRYTSKYTTLNVTDVGIRLIGDFNGDNLVDGLDYVVWRNSYGNVEFEHPADANANNLIDDEDFELWKWNYGRSASPGSGGLAVVPEPAAIWLLLVASGVGCIKYRHR